MNQALGLMSDLFPPLSIPHVSMKSSFRAFGLLAVIFFANSSALFAQELGFFWGRMSAPALDERSFTWQIDYRQYFHQNFAASVAYLNEGHVTSHHRDGTAWQVWARIPFDAGRFEFSLGGGVYYFYDTQYAPDGSSANLHGTAPIYSLTATTYFSNRWFGRALFNQIDPNKGPKVNTVALGVGFWFGRDKRPLPGKLGDAPDLDDYVTESELNFFVGQSVVNTFLSEDARAFAVEYRRGVIPHVDWTLSGIYEGDPTIIRRNGIATQLWGVNTFSHRRIAVGIGVGPYFYIDKKNPSSITLIRQKIPAAIAPLVSLTFATRISEHWQARLVWDRVTTSYNRDADIFRIGFGYRWGNKIAP
jgi:hypothetical protein